MYPADVAVPSVDEAERRKNERRLASLGIARKKTRATPGEPVSAGEAGERAVVEGVKGEWRVDPAALGRDFEGRTALLSPFDRLVHDRVRAHELLDFEYTLEMYKPAAKRRWGYFAIPILHEDRLVGKLAAAADHKASVLRVNAIHEDVPLRASSRQGIERTPLTSSTGAAEDSNRRSMSRCAAARRRRRGGLRRARLRRARSRVAGRRGRFR